MAAACDFDENLFRAKLAEQTERYSDMVMWMKKVVEIKQSTLIHEERNLLITAYKNVIGRMKPGWRAINSIEQSGIQQIQIVKEFRIKLDKEINEVISDLIDVIDKKLLIAEGLSIEDKVFYYKTKGDFCRYTIEYSCEYRIENVENANKAYMKAVHLLETEGRSLGPSNVTRLSLALQYSVFLYENLHNPIEAYRMSKVAYEDARTELMKLDPENIPKEILLILPLLRDNCTLWQCDILDVQDV